MIEKKKFKASKSGIYSDIENRYLEYMGDKYDISMKDETLIKDLGSILVNNTKTIHINILEKQSDFFVFESSAYSKLSRFTNHQLWIFGYLRDKWVLSRFNLN